MASRSSPHRHRGCVPSKGPVIVLCDCAARKEAAHARWKAETRAKAHNTRTTALVRQYDSVAAKAGATYTDWDNVAQLAHTVNTGGSTDQTKAIEAAALMKLLELDLTS
jgi:hypothetical protein